MELQRWDSEDSDDLEENGENENEVLSEGEIEMEDGTNLLFDRSQTNLRFEMEPMLSPSSPLRTNGMVAPCSTGSHPSGRGPIRTSSGTLLYARNPNLLNGGNNSSSSSGSSGGHSPSFSARASRSASSPTAGTTSSSFLSASFNAITNHNFVYGQIVNRYRSSLMPNNTSAVTVIPQIHRTRSINISGSNGRTPNNPRIHLYIKVLFAMILLCIVVNYWERVSWNTYILNSSTTLYNETKSVRDPKKKQNTNKSKDTVPPAVSPTATTLVHLPTPKHSVDDDSDDNVQNSPYYIDKPSIVLRPTFTSSSSNNQPSSYLSVYEAYNRTQQQQPPNTKRDRPNNSYVTWFQIPFDKKSSSNQKNIEIPDNGEFVKKWCDMTGTSWYPANPKPSNRNNSTWQVRAPYFLLPGAAYSGTVYMSSLLHRHPQIVPTRTKELQFFHDKPFRKYIHPKTDKTLVHAARQRMYARDYNVPQLQRNPTFLSFDATPGYFYYSTTIPRRILCVEPWIKIVILLRNPVDRILEQYYAQYSSTTRTSSRNQTPEHLSLDALIQEELKLMKEIGLLNHTTTREKDAAWEKYQALSKTGGLIGRSMYVIQLRQWIDAFRMSGRLPSSSILVVYSENFVLQPQHEYDRIVQFINIASHTIPAVLLKQIPPSLTHQTRYVSDETRQVLEDFFAPYNQQLVRFLYRYNISSTSD